MASTKTRKGAWFERKTSKNGHRDGLGDCRTDYGVSSNARGPNIAYIESGE